MSKRKNPSKTDKNFNSSKSNMSQMDWLILQGKFETLGSNFSHETRLRGCWRPCYYEISCLCPLKKQQQLTVSLFLSKL